jgi:hypothetical protein
VVFWRFYGFKSRWKFFGWHGAFVLTIFFIIGDFFENTPNANQRKENNIFTVNGKFDKSNKKKNEGKKAHAEDWTQTSSGLPAKFKFLSQVSYKQRHPHPLMQILIDAAQYLIERYWPPVKNFLFNFESRKGLLLCFFWFN